MLTGNIIINLVSEIEVKQKNLNSQGADIKNPSIENLDIKDLNFKDLNFEKMIKIQKTPRVISNEGGTSGRAVLWQKSFQRFNKNKIFGYGPQADRYLLNDETNKYGNNVSNTIIYALLSGGYFSLSAMIIIFIYTLYLIYKFIINNNILKKNLL